MITVNVEILLENSLTKYSNIESVTKESLLRDKAAFVQEVVVKQLPEIEGALFMISPGASWNKLPKTLYKVTDPMHEGAIIIRKTRKKMVIPCSEYATFSMHMDTEMPDVKVTLPNNELI